MRLSTVPNESNRCVLKPVLSFYTCRRIRQTLTRLKSSLQNSRPSSRSNGTSMRITHTKILSCSWNGVLVWREVESRVQEVILGMLGGALMRWTWLDFYYYVKATLDIIFSARIVSSLQKRQLLYYWAIKYANSSLPVVLRAKGDTSFASYCTGGRCRRPASAASSRRPCRRAALPPVASCLALASSGPRRARLTSCRPCGA